MDRLQGVQRILRMSGLGEASRLDEPTNPSPSGRAHKALEDASRTIQADGWHFNIRKDVTLTPMADGRIEVPFNAIKIDTDGPDSNIDVIQRGSYLYRVDTNTDVFDRPIKVRMILYEDFDCLPFDMQEYIAAYAAERMLRTYMLRQESGRASVAEQTRLRDTEAELVRLRVKAKRYDQRTSDRVLTVDGMHGLYFRGTIFGNTVRR